ncbi:hypothetical protein [Azospirillum melinis]
MVVFEFGVAVLDGIPEHLREGWRIASLLVEQDLGEIAKAQLEPEAPQHDQENDVGGQLQAVQHRAGALVETAPTLLTTEATVAVAVRSERSVVLIEWQCGQRIPHLQNRSDPLRQPCDVKQAGAKADRTRTILCFQRVRYMGALVTLYGSIQIWKEP